MKVSKGTLIRTIVLFIALLNSLFLAFGVTQLDIEEEQVATTVNAIYEAVSYVFLISASVSAWWKNNSFTKAAIEADETLSRVKSRSKNK